MLAACKGVEEGVVCRRVYVVFWPYPIRKPMLLFGSPCSFIEKWTEKVLIYLAPVPRESSPRAWPGVAFDEVSEMASSFMIHPLWPGGGLSGACNDAGNTRGVPALPAKGCGRVTMPPGASCGQRITSYPRLCGRAHLRPRWGCSAVTGGPRPMAERLQDPIPVGRRGLWRGAASGGISAAAAFVLRPVATAFA